MFRSLKERFGMSTSKQKVQPNIKAKRSSLITMPNEVLAALNLYLDPLATTALSHTCQKLRGCFTADRTCGIFDPEDLVHALDQTRPDGVASKSTIVVTSPLGPSAYTGFNLTRRPMLTHLERLEMNVDSNMYWIRDQSRFEAPNLSTLILRLQPSDSSSLFSYPDGLPIFFRGQHFPELSTFVLTENNGFKTTYSWTQTLLKALLTFLNNHKNLETLKFPPLWTVEKSTRPVLMDSTEKLLDKVVVIGGHVTFLSALQTMCGSLGSQSTEASESSLRVVEYGEAVPDKETTTNKTSNLGVQKSVRVLHVISGGNLKLEDVQRYFTDFPNLKRLYLESLPQIPLTQELTNHIRDASKVVFVSAYSHKTKIPNFSVKKLPSSGQYVCLHIRRDHVQSSLSSPFLERVEMVASPHVRVLHGNRASYLASEVPTWPEEPEEPEQSTQPGQSAPSVASTPVQSTSTPVQSTQPGSSAQSTTPGQPEPSGSTNHQDSPNNL